MSCRDVCRRVLIFSRKVLKDRVEQTEMCIRDSSPLIQNAVTVLMILSGVNYTVYFCLLSRQFKEAFSIEEVRWYFLIRCV